MVKSYYATPKIYSIYKKITTFTKSQKLDKKISIGFNEKYAGSR
jgi:hypothetical protein